MTNYILYDTIDNGKTCYAVLVFDRLSDLDRWAKDREGAAVKRHYCIQRIDIDPAATYQSAECRKVDINGLPIIEMDGNAQTDAQRYSQFRT